MHVTNHVLKAVSFMNTRTHMPLPRWLHTCVLAAALLLLAGALRPAVASAATFDPLNVIPYETFRGASSLSTADIQAFLSTQSGPLASLVTADYAGKKKPASQIIFEAARAWNLNPKVIIATLQKEESLITVSNSSNASRLRKAMGCGIYSGSTNTYAGFGAQVWNGTRKLSTYEVQFNWKPGTKKSVTAYKSVTATKTVSGKVVTYAKTVSYTKTIVPANASTFALYTYTPYYPQSLVWTLYVRFFGDPQTPPRMRPLYRFRNKSNGTYYYTQSEAQRYTLIRNSAKTWAFDGVSLSTDSSSTRNTSPLYQLHNTRTHAYLYTASLAQREQLRRVRPLQWHYDGAAAWVSTQSSGTTPVFRLYNKKTHATLFTSSAASKTHLTTGRSAAFSYKGIAFYLGASAPATPAVGPTSLP
jgi:hypothetical protein